MEESNAGTYNHLRLRKIGRELAEMLHAERGWKLLVNIGEADLLACLAARRLKGGFCVFCSAYREGISRCFSFPFFFQFRLRRPTRLGLGFLLFSPFFPFFLAFTLNVPTYHQVKLHLLHLPNKISVVPNNQPMSCTRKQG